jgi:hypothetical protein
MMSKNPVGNGELDGTYCSCEDPDPCPCDMKCGMCLMCVKPIKPDEPQWRKCDEKIYHLEIGKTYKRVDGKSFSFDEPTGIYIGLTSGCGMPRFKLSGTRECFINATPSTENFVEVGSGLATKEDKDNHLNAENGERCQCDYSHSAGITVQVRNGKHYCPRCGGEIGKLSAGEIGKDEIYKVVYDIERTRPYC